MTKILIGTLLVTAGFPIVGMALVGVAVAELAVAPVVFRVLKEEI